MQFRERRRVIQVIRTTYDPALKRGRALVVGTLDKDAPAVGEDLRAALTADELAEVTAYIDARRGQPAAVPALPQQMRAAAAYFRDAPADEALALAAEIRAAWEELKEAMRDAGFSKGKLRRHAKATG